MGKAEGTRGAKYDAILEGALRSFAESGFHGTRVSNIARAAGVADGTIYLYFKRKEDILIRLFEEKLSLLVADIRGRLDSVRDPRDALAQIVETHYGTLEANPALAHVTQIELRRCSLELRREIGMCLKPYLALIEGVAADGRARGVFRSGLDSRLAAHLVFGAMDEVVSSWLVSGRKFSLAAQTEGTCRFLLGGLGAAAEREESIAKQPSDLGRGGDPA